MHSQQLLVCWMKNRIFCSVIVCINAGNIPDFKSIMHIIIAGAGKVSSHLAKSDWQARRIYYCWRGSYMLFLERFRLFSVTTIVFLSSMLAEKDYSPCFRYFSQNQGGNCCISRQQILSEHLLAKLMFPFAGI